MKKVVIKYDEDSDSFYASDGTLIVACVKGNYMFEEYEEPNDQAEITQNLIKLGVSVDEIIKLKSNGLV